MWAFVGWLGEEPQPIHQNQESNLVIRTYKSGNPLHTWRLVACSMISINQHYRQMLLLALTFQTPTFCNLLAFETLCPYYQHFSAEDSNHFIPLTTKPPSDLWETRWTHQNSHKACFGVVWVSFEGGDQAWGQLLHLSICPDHHVPSMVAWWWAVDWSHYNSRRREYFTHQASHFYAVNRVLHYNLFKPKGGITSGQTASSRGPAKQFRDWHFRHWRGEALPLLTKYLVMWVLWCTHG